jgi:thiamine pyrophosphokinase
MFDESEFPDPAWGDLDWLSEEKYNVMKKEANMPKKKKKVKKKKKKAKKKKKR